ncbi:MAG TPA: hypothetical protein VNU44_08870 [Bryobacteraceae bacterium]|nr:hypothetical protein [Bryobacteraceae bacterium]
MKIIDAIWEKRNLGVTCVEVALDATDTVREVKYALAFLEPQYLVVKVPAGRTDLMFCLSEIGCSFIEAAIHVTRKVDDLELSGIQKRLADSVSYAPMQESDLRVLWDEIRNGMYETDRVSLDSHFTKEQASNRYIGWIQDEIARGTDVYKLVYKDQSIGHFTMKDLGNGVYYPFLAGMYRSHRTSGLGFNITYKPLCEIAARGGTSLSTYISTNNDSAVRLHASLGFRFEEITYVYTRHNRAPNEETVAA